MTNARTDSPYRRALIRHWVPAVAVTVIALQLAVRSFVAFGGYFYWDDLVLVARAGTQPLLSWGYLFDDHDGHVMPGAFLVAGIISRLAPLVWVWPVVSLLVLQLLASLALLRALHVILGWRPVLLIPLTFAAFSTLAVPGFAWWAAALNSLPMLAAMAWVCGDAILLVRTGNQRYASSAVLVFLGGLLFFEKAAVIPFVAFGVVALLAHVRGDTAPVRTVWTAGKPLWTWAAAVLGAWIFLYLIVVDQRRWVLDVRQAWELLSLSVTGGIVPSLAGGPWVWDRWLPISPWAQPPPLAMALGWLTLAALVAVSFARKRRIMPVWLAAVGYAAACQVPIYLMRASSTTPPELAQSLRYLPDLVVVAALLAAVAFCAPNRPGSERFDVSASRAVVVAAVGVAFVASSVYSTATFRTAWRDNPTKSYLQNVQAGLAQAPRNIPLIDQAVDPFILQRLSYPENMMSHMFALVPERPEFSSSTTDLRVFDSHGRLVEASATWVRYTEVGPVQGCGYLVQPGAPVRMPLSGLLLPAEWTAEVNYLANIDGTMTVTLSDGDPVQVPVRPGLNRVFVRLSGAGEAIDVTADTSALSVCLASGPVGYALPK